MGGKKRKRQEEGGERPAKRTAIAAPKGKAGVKYIENSEVLGPVLASTPGLNFPSRISFQPYKHTKTLPSGESSELILQSSEHDRLDYLAREEKDGSSESQLKDYIGVYDPATGKLQLMPVRRVTVRSTLRSETEELQKQQERVEAARSTMTAKRHALAAEFGSEKSRKAIEDMTLNAISRGKAGDANAPRTDSVAENVLQNMSSTTAAMPSRQELAAAIKASMPRPAANASAEYPEDVYSIDTVVGKELMQLLPVKDWVDASEAGQGVSVGSRFVAKRILKLARNKQIQKLKVLRFILLCIKFNDALKSGGKGPKKVPPKEKLETAMGEEGAVVNTIRRKFASETNDLPRWNHDNLMAHVCAAALITDGFEVDVNDLREDLKLDNQQIRQHFHDLGCRVGPPNEVNRTKLKITKAESGNHWMAKLKVPLQFPKLKTGPKKRR